MRWLFDTVKKTDGSARPARGLRPCANLCARPAGDGVSSRLESFRNGRNHKLSPWLALSQPPRVGAANDSSLAGPRGRGDRDWAGGSSPRTRGPPLVSREVDRVTSVRDCSKQKNGPARKACFAANCLLLSARPGGGLQERPVIIESNACRRRRGIFKSLLKSLMAANSAHLTPPSASPDRHRSRAWAGGT